MRQVVSSGIVNDLHNTNTEYHAIRWHGTWNGTETRRQELVPASAKIKALFVELNGSPGTALQSYTFTVRNNAGDTAAAVTIAGSDTQAKILDQDISIVATDKINLKVVPSGTPTVVKAQWCAVFETDGDGTCIFFSGRHDLLDIAVPNETTHIDGGTNWSGATGIGSVGKNLVLPLAGTFSDFYVELDGTAGPTGTDGWVFKPRKNGTDSGITVSILGSSTTGNDTSNTFTTVAGDLVLLQAQIRNSGTARRVKWGIKFESDEADLYPLMGGSVNKLHQTNTEYNYIGSIGGTWNGTETNRRMLISCARLSRLYVELGDTPGSGKSYIFDVMKNGSTTGMTVTISDSATTGNDTTNIVECDDFDNLSIRCRPTGTPTLTDVTWGVAVESIFPFPNSLAMVGVGR